MRVNFHKLGRFGLAGGLATFISYLSFPLIYETFFDRQLFILSYIMASFINITVSYVLQRKFVFKSNKHWLPEYIYFWINASLLMLTAFFILYGLVHWLHVNSFLSNFIVVTFAAIASYLIHNSITFGKIQ